MGNVRQARCGPLRWDQWTNVPFIRLFGLFGLIIYSDLTVGSPSSAWSAWWRYEGISGPEYWGKINPDWTLCEKGKQQSPVNIDPKSLVYDPNLRPFKLERKRVDGIVMNTGRDVTFALRDDPSSYINILTGPFSYRYRIHEMKIHFGTVDTVGSEHTIGGQSFTAEIHLIAYNIDLYENYTSALASPHGIVSIAVFATIGGKTNDEFEVIAKEFKNLRFKGESRNITQLLLADIIPKTEHYMTYEGSLTQPGCQETVTWIVLNKPIYVTKGQMRHLRMLNQEETPGSILLGNNIRPVMPLNRRTIRTNISPEGHSKDCAIKKELFYTVGEKYQTHPTRKNKKSGQDVTDRQEADPRPSRGQQQLGEQDEEEGKIGIIRSSRFGNSHQNNSNNDSNNNNQKSSSSIITRTNTVTKT